MHTYSINSPERTNVPFIIAGISIGLVLFAKYRITLPSWVPVPGVFALYGVLYTIFDKWLWRPLSLIGLIKTPDLNGNWRMLSKSSMTDFLKEYEGTLIINQTWTTISLLLDGEKFTSESTMAGIDIKTDSIFTLKWEYLSKKKPEFADQDYMHTGMTRVSSQLKAQDIILKGDYFTDKSRHNYGSIHMFQIKKA